jgi:hypothetical protein
LQASLSCPGVIARPGMVFVVVLIQRRGVAWRDATVPVVTARWWLTNYPVRRGLAVAFVIISCSPGGVVASAREQMAAPRSLVAFACHDTSGLDLGRRGRGPGGGWGRMPILSGWVWTVGCRISRHRLTVLSCPCRDGVCPRDGCPLSPSGVNGVCLSLLGHAYLTASSLSLSLPGGGDE